MIYLALYGVNYLINYANLNNIFFDINNINKMLLELLQHHQEFFLAAIEPLTLRRDCRSLSALGGTCNTIHACIVQLDFYQHYIRNKYMLKSAKICKAIFDDDMSSMSIIMYGNKITHYTISYNQPRIIHTYLNCYRGRKWDFWFSSSGFPPIIHNISDDVLPEWILDGIERGLIYNKKSINTTDILIDSSQIYS